MSLNGPPTADTAIGAGLRPVTMKITVENSTSPATKAPSASSRRAVRAVIDDSRLAETGDQPGADHLEKNSGAVMRPQRYGAGQHETQRPCRNRDGGAARRGGVRDRDVFRHIHHIGPIRLIGNRRLIGHVPSHPILTSAPPSTGSATPVMKLASSEARNSAALATSQAVPILPRSGTRALRVSRTADVVAPIAAAIPEIAIGVSIRPGSTALQRTPWLALALATLVVSRFMPALD